MIIPFFVFTAVGFGLYLVLTGFMPSLSRRSAIAVGSRAKKKDTLSTVLVSRIAIVILPLLSLDPVNHRSLARTLQVAGVEKSPERFEAEAWGTGLLYGISILALAPFFYIAVLLLLPDLSFFTVIKLAGLLAAVLLFWGRAAVRTELDQNVTRRKEIIEWELPQFSGTILQSLGHTRNVIDILESYRKICSPVLKIEIEQTLNEMRTGNHETAIKNLSGRINSGSFSQLAQGLIGLLRGDDQKSYFQIITNEFSKSQQELIKKELLSRPQKLTINNIILLVGMMLMLFVAIGGYLMDSSAGLF